MYDYAYGIIHYYKCLVYYNTYFPNIALIIILHLLISLIIDISLLTDDIKMCNHHRTYKSILLF